MNDDGVIWERCTGPSMVRILRENFGDTHTFREWWDPEEQMWIVKAKERQCDG